MGETDRLAGPIVVTRISEFFPCPVESLTPMWAGSACGFVSTVGSPTVTGSAAGIRRRGTW